MGADAEAPQVGAPPDGGDKEPGGDPVRAVPVNDGGPCDFLRTRSGRVAACVAAVVITGLAIGLSVGLTRKDGGGDGGGKGHGDPASSREQEVLTTAGGNLCTEMVPQAFYGDWPTLCTGTEVSRGGTLQQAVADAQLIQSRKRPGIYADFSVLNAGAVWTELASGQGITLQDARNILPYGDNNVSYVELTPRGVARMIRNAVDFCAQAIPLKPGYAGAYPYASGIRYDVNMSAPEGEERVTNFRVYDEPSRSWVPLLPSKEDGDRTYWIVTNSYVSPWGGDWYLNNVTSVSSSVSERRYTDELVNYLRDLGVDGRPWMPPSLDEMSTAMFTYSN